jgi:hypothetical protein
LEDSQKFFRRDFTVSIEIKLVHKGLLFSLREEDLDPRKTIT